MVSNENNYIIFIQVHSRLFESVKNIYANTYCVRRRWSWRSLAAILRQSNWRKSLQLPLPTELHAGTSSNPYWENANWYGIQHVSHRDSICRRPLTHRNRMKHICVDKLCHHWCRQWLGASFLNTKPLSEPILVCYQMDVCGHISVKFESLYKINCIQQNVASKMSAISSTLNVFNAWQLWYRITFYSLY